MMHPAFSLPEAVAILEAAPGTLRALLGGLPERLLDVNEGEGTWSARQVVQHLIWGEVDDWMPRVRVLREHGGDQAFAPFVREEGFARYAGWSMDALLDEFARERAASLAALAALGLQPADMDAPGRHPAFGPVTLGELLATWTAHDLGHLVQISRVLAKDVARHVGPWRAYLSVAR